MKPTREVELKYNDIIRRLDRTMGEYRLSYNEREKYWFVHAYDPSRGGWELARLT